MVALSLLFGLVGARNLVQQRPPAPVREIAASIRQVPEEVRRLLGREGLLLVETANPEGTVLAGVVPLGLVMEPVEGEPGRVRARFLARVENARALAKAGELTALVAQGSASPLIPTVGLVGLADPDGAEWTVALLTLLVLVPAIGATGAAAELGAGERERRTLEALLITPVPPFVLAGAKLAAVLASSLLAGGLAATIQLLLLLSPAGRDLLPEGPLSAALPMLLLCVTVSVLISGPALVLSLIARSMREAMLAMIPLNLSSVALAYLAVALPTSGLPGGVWLTPGLNALLLVRLALAGASAGVGQVVAVLVTTLLLGLGLTWLAARQLRREAVL